MGGFRRSGGWRVLGVFLLVSLLIAGLGGAPAARAAQITVPAGDVIALIAAINTANVNPDADEIVLADGAIYTLTAVNHGGINDATGLPQVTSPITIIGNGATITRSSTAPFFRILSVAAGATLTLQQVTISNGAVTISGGIYNAGTLTLTASTVKDNLSDVGAGIFNMPTGLVTLTDSTVSGNSATAEGGGIYNHGMLTLTNSTVSGNSVAFGLGGGGIFNTNNGVASLTNSTVSGNSATAGGGILNSESGNPTLTLTNTLVAGNTAPLGPDILGRLSGTYNLIGNGTGINGLLHGTNGNQIGTSQAPINPLLSPLADNGGPTQTHLPSLDSPVINAANTLVGSTSDQRGISRPQGAASDIGAVEFEVPTHADLCVLTQQVVRSASVARSACAMLGIAQVADQQGNPTVEQVALTSYQLQIRSAQSRRYVSAADAVMLITWLKLL